MQKNCDPKLPMMTTSDPGGQETTQTNARFVWTENTLGHGQPDAGNRYVGRLDDPDGEWVDYSVPKQGQIGAHGNAVFEDLALGQHTFEATIINECDVPSTTSLVKVWTINPA